MMIKINTHKINTNISFFFWEVLLNLGLSNWTTLSFSLNYFCYKVRERPDFMLLSSTTYIIYFPNYASIFLQDIWPILFSSFSPQNSDAS
jgi:hypothetical protein